MGVIKIRHEAQSTSSYIHHKRICGVGCDQSSIANDMTLNAYAGNDCMRPPGTNNAWQIARYERTKHSM